MSKFAAFLTNPQPGDEIVISGISGKFPSSDDMHEFQEKLFNKEDMVEEITKRWHFDSELMPQRGGTINNIEIFDAGFFGVHSRQAHHMDPMIRVFLETALEAIFDAGLNPKELEGTRTGVYVGACWSDAEYTTLSGIKDNQMMGITGFLRALISHRLAYFLKLKGPCLIADTACSSSFNALESAFKDIRSGKCDRALVGGVNLTLFPGSTLQFYKLGVLSLDGKCKVFDEDADGYVRSETIVCVLLEKARDSRRIYAQVVHVKVNDDGFKESGITFPSTEMQCRLMDEVYKESGVNPNNLAYLEGHCTGTRVGDPEETAAIDSVLAKKREKPLLIGSVKSNIGHTEPCSGLCSIAKVIVAMETGLIPPNINLKSLRKCLTAFHEGRLKLIQETTPLDEGHVFVGINNFGFGGNNCHLVLRRLSEKRDLREINDSLPRLVCASGRSKDAVLKILEDVHQREFNVEYIGLLQEIFNFDVKGHIYRGFTIVSDKKSVKVSVNRICDAMEPLHLYFGSLDRDYKIVGKSLLGLPSFRDALIRFNCELKETNLDIFDIILKEQDSLLWDVLGSVAVQIAFCDVLKAVKLNPASVHGNSWGKLASLYFQGYLNIKHTVKFIFENKNFLNLNGELEELSNGVQIKDINSNPNTHSVIIDLSNSALPPMNGSGFLEQFLEIIGRLYESGCNPQIQNLYPNVKFPVSRGTPMISPLISWNHSKTWFTCKHSNESTKENSRSFQTEITYHPLNYEHSYIQGHVVDGRNLFPATGYLFMVWKELASKRHLVPNDIGIVFEDVCFLKAATFPKSGYLTFVLSVQMDGSFEISQAGVVGVRGKATLSETVKESSKLPVTNFNNSVSVVDTEDIYKELHLRGYNYNGLFQSIVKANIDRPNGLIKWEDNWVAFMDNMLQLMLIQYDTRSIYIPTGIKMCTIIPSKHSYEKNDDVPVTIYKEANLIKCESIEIQGLQAQSIARKKLVNEPILEKYVFVPNSTILSLEESLRINMQIVLENRVESCVTGLELFDDSVEALLPKINRILEDVPLINTDFTISSKLEPEQVRGDLDSIKVDDVYLTTENNYLLLIASNISSSKNALRCLKKDSFLLTREDRNFVPGEIEGVKILTVHTTEDEKLILLRKSEEIYDYITIEVRSCNFEWLTQLQKVLKTESKRRVLIYSQNQSDSGILGLINCVLRENGGDRVKCFFILGDAPKFDIDHEFYKNQLEKGFSINILKDGKWGTYRHLPLNEIQATDNEHCVINNTVKGDLSSLKWLHGNLSSKYVTNQNNLVKVHYAAVNFKDIMLASGRIPTETLRDVRLELENILGFEYSGVNLSGKRVMGMLKKQALATIVESDPEFTWEVPKEWSLEEAATVPIVYSTVIYGLLLRAKLRRGTSVLIHSGTGGIGLAALNICSYYGFNIFVTVGTEEKRQYLRKHFPHISNNHIGNSRDTSFEQMIEKQTRGRGVDIVLNSLAEEKLLASVRCLARGGLFVEIGKFDFSQNNPLSLLLIKKEASFHGVMLDTFFVEASEVKEKIMSEMQKGINIGYIKPLKTNIFKHVEATEAFKFMTAGKHIGKVLIKIRESESDARINIVKGLPRVYCDNLKSYVIIGGLGGFGLELADWLVTRGVRKLILSSRQGVKNGYQIKRIRIWESYGVSVRISTSDVTTREGCLNLIKEAEDVGAVEGIFNLGVVLKDAAFENQTERDFEISFGPKAFATKFLDEITRKSCHNLKHFVVFSSISCGRGNAGQTNYGMANSVMERICENRRRDGLPGLAIEWGAIGDVGLVAQLAKNNVELEIRGTLQQRISNCLEILDRLLTQTESAIVSSMVVASKTKSHGSGTAHEAVLRILGITDEKTISRQATLTELGMDSITATEIIQILETNFGIQVTTKEIRIMTIDGLVEIENSLAENDGQGIESREGNMIVFMPEGNVSKIPISRMVSKVDDNKVPMVFVLPGFEGSLQSLEPITKELSCVCLGLKYNFASVDLNIEEMAKCFAPYIEDKLLWRNTFNIICHSYGGHLSMEIAHMLEERGYVGNIFVLDSGIEYLSQSIDKKLKPRSETEFESAFIYNILELILPLDSAKPHKEKLMELDTFKKRIDYAYSVVVANGIKDLTEFEERILFTFNRVKAFYTYKFPHEKLKSTVYLFKASSPLIQIASEDYGWSNISQNPVTVNVIEGSHSSMLNDKYLPLKIAEILQK